MKIFLCGDVMTGRGIDQILKHPERPEIFEDYVKDARDYVGLAENKNGPIPRKVADDYIWGKALEIWNEQSPDVKIINLETAITSSETPLLDKGINYRMHPRNVSVLKRSEVDICTLANNHVLDWGPKGLEETIGTLDGAHIKHAGAGNSLQESRRPAIYEGPNGRVLVFSMCFESSGVPWNWEASEERPGVWLLYSTGPDAIAEVDRVISRYRQEGDLVIASIHWGSNWGQGISGAQRSFAHGLIEFANVDIIHGHSSHHPRAIEIHKGRPVFYGCGDFINDYEGIHGYEEFRGDLSLMYFVECRLRPFRLESLSMNCMQIKRLSLSAASADDSKWMLDSLTDACSSFGTRFEATGKNQIKVKV